MPGLCDTVWNSWFHSRFNKYTLLVFEAFRPVFIKNRPVYVHYMVRFLNCVQRNSKSITSPPFSYIDEKEYRNINYLIFLWAKLRARRPKPCLIPTSLFSLFLMCLSNVCQSRARSRGKKFFFSIIRHQNWRENYFYSLKLQYKNCLSPFYVRIFTFEEV